MSISRRKLLAGAAAAPFLAQLGAPAFAQRVDADRFDPWLEIDPAAFEHNVATISRLAGGRPILAVIKNNAYGLGLTEVAPLLEPMTAIAGFAVVKAAEAIALRDAGIRKPILLMSLFADADGPELIRRGIELSLCTDDSGRRMVQAAAKARKRAHAHIYLDTGMSRMGIPYHRALPVLQSFAELDLTVHGTFMGFTEESEFDRVQLTRFRDLSKKATDAGVELGTLHAASSHAVFGFKEAHLDMVRPGIALFGAYPSDAEAESAIAHLEPAMRLKARIVRVERLRKGDSVSYGRNYIAERATWIATIPAGHTDGLPRKAVEGSRVLVNGNTYPVIGAVSASHTIIELGEEKTASIGDEAILMGPDHADVHPNALASASGTSVYDRLMHLNPLLPKVVKSDV